MSEPVLDYYTSPAIPLTRRFFKPYSIKYLATVNNCIINLDLLRHLFIMAVLNMFAVSHYVKEVLDADSLGTN